MNSIHEPGRCAMRGECGTIFKQLPCPDNELATLPERDHRKLLTSVCGPAYAQGPVCCSIEQVETMQAKFQMAYPLISSCPACRNNFRSFFCDFTCSPDQSTFLNVSLTQPGGSNSSAVKTVDFAVTESLGRGFYDSCKDVLLLASNSYALDFIAPGAKDYQGFLFQLGKEEELRSPFQINFPTTPPPGLVQMDTVPRLCNDTDLINRCPCLHCPNSCPVGPGAPELGPVCHVGLVSCMSFVLLAGYAAAVFAYLGGFVLKRRLRRRREQQYERVALSTETPVGDNTISPTAHSRGLVGASSLAPYSDGDDSLGGYSDSRRLGRGASLLDPSDSLQPRKYRLNTILRQSFYRVGKFCAFRPWATFAITLSIVAVLNIGWNRADVETDPVRLWVAPNSDSKRQKDYFDKHFGPFYRTEQIFLTAVGSNGFSFEDNPGAVLSFDRLRWWIGIEQDIKSLRSSPNGYQLTDVCFKPSGACVVWSVAAWFGNKEANVQSDTWREQILKCSSDPSSDTCRPDFLQPLAPTFVLGGIPVGSANSTRAYLEAKALVITFVVQGSLDVEERAKAEEWERTVRQYLSELGQESERTAGTRISFSTEISLEEEINKSTNTDVKIVVLSYVAMFFYIALALGLGATSHKEEDRVTVWPPKWASRFLGCFKRFSSSDDGDDLDHSSSVLPRLSAVLVGSKFSLALFGLGLVVLSILSTVGFFSVLNVKVTLIIAEVIPFLVLAVGVDNIFILVHELERQNEMHGRRNSFLPATSTTTGQHASRGDIGELDGSVDGNTLSVYLEPEERVARTLAKMGPSILLSSLTQTIAFALGAIVPMPAVRNFALYAAGSVLLNAVLQMTAFVSALAVDLRRTEANRLDCVPCIKIQTRIMLPGPSPRSSHLLTRFLRRYYLPFILHKEAKAVICIVFAGFFVLSVISMQRIRLGLDQRLALPSESYLIPYFNALDDYFEIGPPVYFVATGVEVERRSEQRLLCASFTTCSDESLVNRLEFERKRRQVSLLSQPPASWIDDFFNWLNPEIDSCCRVKKSNPEIFCDPDESERRCQPCFAGKLPAWNITMEGFPESEEFMRYLHQWITYPTSEDCPLGGQASYGSSLSFSSDGQSVTASHFRTFNEPLKTQEQFISAFHEAHRIAQDVSEDTGKEIFAFSPFYVFFDQYAHIIATAQEVLGLGLASTLIMTSLLLGSWRTGILVTAVVASTVTTVMGIMGIWGIMLNAISLVNLVISLGIGVEFCSHIARAFMGAGAGLPVDHPAGQRERDERVWLAMIGVGPSVLTGVTFTKLIGMSVLAFTRSRLLEIYYFRMWITLIVSGALHGLVLLPVILSFAGGPGYALEDEDEEWLTQVSRRHDYEYRPFHDDDQDSSSSL